MQRAVDDTKLKIKIEAAIDSPRTERATVRVRGLLEKSLVKSARPCLDTLRYSFAVDESLKGFQLQDIRISTSNPLKYKTKTTTLYLKVAREPEGEKVIPGHASISYFWSESEHLDFVALYHRYGRRWKQISEKQGKRNALQCRTHGQKYIMALQNFLDDIKTLVDGKSPPSKEFFSKVSKYEAEKRSLIARYPPQDALKFYPQYLLKKVDPTLLAFEEKLSEIALAIQAEITHQNGKETENKIEQEPQ